MTESPEGAHRELMTDPSKVQRWLDLIAFLASRRTPATVDELWRNIPAYERGIDADDGTHAAVRRTFERDKGELRELGIAIETVTFNINYGFEQTTGYRLPPKSFHLPYLKLVRQASGAKSEEPPPRDAFEITEAESAAALGGLRDVASLPSFPLSREARSAFRKIAFDLDVDMLRDDPIVYADHSESAAGSEALRRLSRAVLARKTVRFDYHSMGRDAHESRAVRPYGLFFQHGRWYLVGFDEARSEPRVFRLGRMTDVTPNATAPGTPDYEVPADFSLDSYTGRSAWELGDDAEASVEATVRFRFPRSLWADRNGHGRLLNELEDGTQLRLFHVHRRDPFLRWILSLEGDASVDAPAELRDEFQAMARAIAVRHGAGADD